MGIDRNLDGADLLGEKVWLEAGQLVRRPQIVSGPRSALITLESGSISLGASGLRTIRS